MDAQLSQLITRAIVAAAAGVVGALLFVLLSTDDPLRISVRKFLVGVLSSSVFTGIALRYASLDASQMDVWIAGAAAVGFSAYLLLGVALKKLTSWAAAWSASVQTLPTPPNNQSLPTAPVPPVSLPPVVTPPATTPAPEITTGQVSVPPTVPPAPPTLPVAGKP